MHHKLPVLLLPEKSDPEFEVLATAWLKTGAEVRRLGKYWIKDPELEGRAIAIYGNQPFAFVLAQIYGTTLIAPDDELILRLNESWTKRLLSVKQKKDLQITDFPIFIKPLVPKMFAAKVFQSLDEFTLFTQGIAGQEEMLTSTIIDDITAEVRCFIKDGALKELAFYEGSGDTEAATDFINDFLHNNNGKLPAVVVVDIAFSGSTGWFILEFNACWGAGLNGCDAGKILDCISGATINA
ncbi:MAG: ATP-grasp domain-containing protein [Taibaiella sp.]|nr:ATP-grasp domain-containing protein [Taibaiella sp.]